jgi:hypothetical protein
MIDKETKRVTIVSHLSPDLDSCTAVWLLTRFPYLGYNHVFKFVPVGSKLYISKNKSQQVIIHVDTGGGEFDHHDKSDYVCAASLVAEKYSISTPGINELVAYTLAVDHGKIFNSDIGRFDILRIIEGLNKILPDKPKEVLEIVLSCLDAIYANLSDAYDAPKYLEDAIYFDTLWGRGAGVISSNSEVRYLAHRQGIKVFVFVDPMYGYRGFMAPGDSKVDFSSLAAKLKKIEPEADWFLHSSKQLLLCGSKKAPNKKLSSLSLDQMIQFIKV